MAVLTIESNGMLEKTAVYYNGAQISGIKELLINIDEYGTFDALIQYDGTDKHLYTKQIFDEALQYLKTVPPSFTEDEAQLLQRFSIESTGNLEDTVIYFNDEPQAGVVSVFIQIKASKNKSGLLSFLKKQDIVDSEIVFRSEITFRNEDDSIETEEIFL
jgi:hypothetical protein